MEAYGGIISRRENTYTGKAISPLLCISGRVARGKEVCPYRRLFSPMIGDTGKRNGSGKRKHGNSYIPPGTLLWLIK